MSGTAPPTGPIISAQGISKTFGQQRALDDVTFTVDPGTIVGLIGPSGCGKTTLVRTLTGIIRPTSGELRVLGTDPVRFTSSHRSAFGYMPQSPVLFPNLSVQSNLAFAGSVYGVPLRHRRRRLMAALELVDLAQHRRKRFADLSGGMQRRLSLAATLVHEPTLVFLDEPTAGVDPILRERFWSHFRSLRDAGRTIVVSTQYVGEAVSCDSVAVMAAGRLLMTVPPAELAERAHGGLPLRVELNGWLPGYEVERLRDEAFVRSATMGPSGLVVAVDASGHDAADRGAAAIRRFFDTSRVDIGEVTPLEPSFDDLFVRIIESDRTSRAHSSDERASAA